MSTAAFVRQAKFLNFRRYFPSPVSAVVNIPSIPYEAIDNSGTKVHLPGIARLMEAARVYTFAKGTSLEFPTTSLVDMDKILTDYYIFIVSSNIRIQKDFHQFESPKFPLYVRSTVHGLGKSSKSILQELFHEGTDALYASCDLTHVLVSKETRKPVRWPDWWLDKYAGLLDGDKVRPPTLEAATDHIVSSSLKVRNSETDNYYHANWVTFIQYCCDNIYEGISAKAFPHLTDSHWKSGFRSVDMSFKAEANFGDQLKVESWETQSQKDSVSSKVLNENGLCYYANFTFYNDTPQHKL